MVYSDPNYYNNTGAAVAAGALTFAAGVAVGSWANNDVDWHHGNVYVNPHNNGWNSWGNDVRINTGDININNIDRDRNDFYRNIDNNNTLDNLQKSQIKDSFGKLNPNDQATQLAKYNKMTPEQRQQSTSNLKNMPGAGGSGTQWQRNPTKPAPPPTATSSQLANYRGQTAAASGATAANFGGRVGGAGAQNLTQPRPSSAQVQQQLASRPATANAQVPSNANFQNRPQTAGQVGGQAAAARPAAQNYERPSAPSTSALSGYGSAAQTQQASNRGQQSLGSSSMNRPQSMPSQNMSRPSAQSQSRPSAPSRPSGGGGGGGGRRR